MSLQGVIDEIVGALQPVVTEIPSLQVYPYWNDNPSPPAIDIYPGDPFQDGAGFGSLNVEAFFTVRARVSIGDARAATELLLRLLDPADAASVRTAIENANAGAIAEGSPGGFRQYADDVPGAGRMIGCEWRIRRFLE